MFHDIQQFYPERGLLKVGLPEHYHTCPIKFLHKFLKL